MCYEVLDLEQGSLEWLSYRQKSITATDTAIIMGLNPWKTPLMLWQEKLGLRQEYVENEAMREGRVLEDEARNFLNKSHDIKFKPCVLKSSIHKFMMASLDGLNSNDEIIEIKCGKNSLKQAMEDHIPLYYYAQMQKQMYITNSSTCLYFCYRSENENKSFVVKRDEVFIKDMIQKELEFYSCMIEFTPPALSEKDYTLREDKEWRILTEVYKQTKIQLKEILEKEKALRDEIITLSGGQSCKGNGVAISKSFRAGNIDYLSIPHIQSIDLEKYRKPKTEVWTIREV